jgi:hypothetical protein
VNVVIPARSKPVAVKWGFILHCMIVASGCNDAQPSKTRARIVASVSSPFAEQSPAMQSLMVTSPSMIELGEVPRGGQKQANFFLTNPGMRAVEVTRIEISCPCLTIDEAPTQIAPGERVSVRAKLDLRDEQNFTGALAIEIKGWTRSGELAFATVAKVSVPSLSEG